MVNEDSHSTDLSVSEEGHSTILLAHYIFWFQLRTQLFRNLVTQNKNANLVPRALFPGFGGGFSRPAPKARENRPGDEVTKMPRNLTFVVQFAYFSIRLSLCNFRYKKQLLKKLRGTFWKISSDLWKALLITIRKYRT